MFEKSVSEAERAWFRAKRGEQGREPSGNFLAGEIDRVFSRIKPLAGYNVNNDRNSYICNFFSTMGRHLDRSQKFYFWFDVALIGSSVFILLLSFYDKVSRYPLFTAALISASLIGLIPVLLSALSALVKKQLTIDLLASIALLASILSQEWQSALFINLMIASARVFSLWTDGRARQAIKSLLKLHPQKIHVRVGEEIKQVRMEDLRRGDLIEVEAGDRIPADGVVESGTASIDESTLTGESEPVTREKGEKVWSSTLNLGGLILVRAERVGADTTFSRIIDLVEKASVAKAPISSMAERFANWYIILALGASLLLYLTTKNLPLVLSVLLVVCADDLAVGIPLGLTAAIGQAARRGIIIKGGRFLEGLSQAEIIVTDKTGTITTGKFQVENYHVFSGYDKKEFLSALGTLESVSNHPLAQAIHHFAKENGADLQLSALSEIMEVPGYGIKAVKSGLPIMAGNFKMLEANGVPISPSDIKLIEEQKSLGRNVLFLAEKGRLVGFVSMKDSIRPKASKVVDELRELGIRRVIMLTGDNQEVARATAEEVHIEEFRANLLPQEKLDYLKSILSPNYKVVMVGDGVNDAAALSLADIGIAMGAIGADAAIESADIVLMKDRLTDIPEAAKLSRYTMKVLKQDLWIWGLTNVVGLFLVFGGIIGPTGAAAYNFLTDFLPLINSSKLFRIRSS
ncbi:cation-translocating P-type ATPase [Candidatus Wolfebacteria bacterium]|nr:cation-translocating P-type ATPase [Candidatus Wolfebacteria bacterium]